MKIVNSLINIGYDKNGELDYQISMDICLLPLNKLNELRKFIPVMIWAYEDMYKSVSEVTYE